MSAPLRPARPRVRCRTVAVAAVLALAACVPPEPETRVGMDGRPVGSFPPIDPAAAPPAQPPISGGGVRPVYDPGPDLVIRPRDPEPVTLPPLP